MACSELKLLGQHHGQRKCLLHRAPDPVLTDRVLMGPRQNSHPYGPCMPVLMGRMACNTDMRQDTV